MANFLKHRLFAFAAFFLFAIPASYAQNSYRYSVDLTKAADDRLQVSLLTPKITKAEITFYLPRIVPGTYMNSNYGKYVHNLKAFDKNGKALTAIKKGDNGWQIKNATTLYRIAYQVEDTWDSQIDNMVYPMAGTNFEAGKNFVINTPGVFGYFDGLKKLPFELSFTKPQGFYGATGLRPVSSTQSADLFRCENTDELYDSPIMFSVPDTTTIKVGNTDVLVAVYSPNKKATSAFIAANMDKLLRGTKDYLGGRLPVDKYAFIFYFNGEQKKLENGGAWEHSYSSFYSMEEAPQEEAINSWVDIAAHEFFHIVTPLTISSREVKEFNYNETVLSKHLWLYEGSTEYYAHHMQLWTGLKSPEEFLEKISTNIAYSRMYFNDTLPFTEMSKESAGKWKEQYVNVYIKGMLISACIDLYLLDLSNGQYALRNLKHDLGVKYGKDRYFNDNELFDEIAKLSYPEIKDFLLTYVQGPTPIPYGKFLSMAGIDYLPEETVQAITLGGIGLQPDSTGSHLMIGATNLDAFGKKLGYQQGDELASINGKAVTLQNANELLTKFIRETKEGDNVTIGVRRKNAAGVVADINLTAAAIKVSRKEQHVVRINPSPTAAQLKIRNAWWGSCNVGKQ